MLAVTLEELAEFSWKDYLNEEELEETLETYLNQVVQNMTNLDMLETVKRKSQSRHRRKSRF